MPVGGGTLGVNRGVGMSGGIGGLHMKMKTVYFTVLLKSQDSLLQTIEHELMWTGPKLVPLLATRCLSLGGLRRHDGVEYIWQNSSLTHRLMTLCWLAVVPLLFTRCLYWGWGWEWWHEGLSGGVRGTEGYIWNMNTVSYKVLLKTQDDLLQTIAHDLMWTGSKLVPHLATRCLSLGAFRGWVHLKNSRLTHRLMTYYADLQ